MNNMKLRTMNHKLRTDSGFTLLETIVAVTILMISIVGPLSLASKGIVYADYVKDEITAFNLAQEAMETIRSIRDENVGNLSTSEWLKDIDKCVSPNICRLDIWNALGLRAGLEQYSSGGVMPDNWLKMNILKIPSPNEAVLYGYNFNSGLLSGVSAGAVRPSLFSRRVTITTADYSGVIPDITTRGTLGLTNPGEVNVTVEVSWRRIPFLPRSIKISENLFSI